MAKRAGQPWPLEAALARITKAVRAGVDLLVVTGQYAEPGTDRVMVLQIVKMVPRERWDGFLATADVEVLRARLSQLGHRVWPGENDAMFATSWKLAWTQAPAPFLLFDRRGLRCSIEGGAVQLHRRWRRASRSIPLSAILRVSSWVSEKGVRRGVSLACRDGVVVVAEQYDFFAALDPTYDQFNLICDAAWADALARSLAAALDRPFVSFEDEG